MNPGFTSTVSVPGGLVALRTEFNTTAEQGQGRPSAQSNPEPDHDDDGQRRNDDPCAASHKWAPQRCPAKSITAAVRSVNCSLVTPRSLQACLVRSRQRSRVRPPCFGSRRADRAADERTSVGVFVMSARDSEVLERPAHVDPKHAIDYDIFNDPRFAAAGDPHAGASPAGRGGGIRHLLDAAQRRPLVHQRLRVDIPGRARARSVLQQSHDSAADARGARAAAHSADARCARACPVSAAADARVRAGPGARRWSPQFVPTPCNS